MIVSVSPCRRYCVVQLIDKKGHKYYRTRRYGNGTAR